MNRYMKQYEHMMDETWDGLEKNLNKKWLTESAGKV